MEAAQSLKGVRMLFLPKGVRWGGQHQQLFCCPRCATVYKKRKYELNEPLGAVGAWAARHTYVSKCPNCGEDAHTINMQETPQGFKQ